MVGSWQFVLLVETGGGLESRHSRQSRCVPNVEATRHMWKQPLKMLPAREGGHNFCWPAVPVGRWCGGSRPYQRGNEDLKGQQKGALTIGDD